MSIWARVKEFAYYTLFPRKWHRGRIFTTAQWMAMFEDSGISDSMRQTFYAKTPLLELFKDEPLG